MGQSTDGVGFFLETTMQIPGSTSEVPGSAFVFGMIGLRSTEKLVFLLRFLVSGFPLGLGWTNEAPIWCRSTRAALRRQKSCDDSVCFPHLGESPGPLLK